jgi:hypothetical protein
MSKTNELIRMLECQRIKGVRLRKFRTGRKEHPWTYTPEFFLSDDLVLSFNVVETKSREYGVELYVAQGTRRPLRRLHEVKPSAHRSQEESESSSRTRRSEDGEL